MVAQAEGPALPASAGRIVEVHRGRPQGCGLRCGVLSRPNRRRPRRYPRLEHRMPLPRSVSPRREEPYTKGVCTRGRRVSCEVRLARGLGTQVSGGTATTRTRPAVHRHHVLLCCLRCPQRAVCGRAPVVCTGAAHRPARRHGCVSARGKSRQGCSQGCKEGSQGRCSGHQASPQAGASSWETPAARRRQCSQRQSGHKTPRSPTPTSEAWLGHMPLSMVHGRWQRASVRVHVCACGVGRFGNKRFLQLRMCMSNFRTTS